MLKCKCIETKITGNKYLQCKFFCYIFLALTFYTKMDDVDIATDDVDDDEKDSATDNICFITKNKQNWT